MSPRKGEDESAKLTCTVCYRDEKNLKSKKKVITSVDVQFSAQNQVKSKTKILHHESFVRLDPAARSPLDTSLNT